MARAFLLVMDSVGIGGAPDAEKFGDEGANTLGHIAQACAAGRADGANGRSGALKVPVLERLGLGLAAQLACSAVPAGLDEKHELIGRWGCAAEKSSGKDTISGHWEMAGLPVLFDWGYFPDREKCFPADFVDKFVAEAKLPGILGNKPASGTKIIAELGSEHIKTGKPICYTSADSVFQISAHEDHFGLQRLYELCGIARKLLDPLNIGRVIARPFVGDEREGFTRTGNRRDYAVPPGGPTLLDRVCRAGSKVHAVGKVSDIFAGKGVSKAYKASGHDALMAATVEAGQAAGPGDLIFTNFVDFDMLYGHPRDVPGYAAALEHFDKLLKNFLAQLRTDDLVIVTADHGNDPTWHGTDHTREQVPVMMYQKNIMPGSFGARPDFCDIGATIADHLGIEAGDCGTSFL